MRLAELQSALDAALAGKECPELHRLVVSLKQSPEDCLALYRQLLRRAHVNALQQLFPACARLLGQDHFQLLAEFYSAQIAAGAGFDPFGAQFPGLMESYRSSHAELEPLVFLADLATLEWHLQEARSARDDPALDLESWASLPRRQQHRMQAVVSYSLGLQYSRWPLAEIRDAVITDRPWQELLAGKGGWLCIHRHLDRLCIEPISETQARMLNGIRQGLSFDSLGYDLNLVQQLLPLMIARGWICRLRMPSDQEPAPES
ncbi:hypothetical protein GCM10011348_14750 [Marinobacterium nitratireducens]|uniref:Putative DNA-binding domain-containing protein n=1 Tax=Marinobacterium nitratireducens TaxID=518897 RepID=A0A917ZBV9_9GAMM|nr:putative DNA-binding domain-containing protein [Marinobacterium nitratireducens]GGO79732.1 hypothetical protein GCM10011348_14750 [Marinobacterium nitratireducens]